MFKKKNILFLIAEAPIHAGSGSEVGIVDLPIQRERYTGLPKIESSGLKGCIREAFESLNKKIQISGKEISPKEKIKYKIDNTEKETDYISLVFGPEDKDAHSGAVTITDGRLLLFPIKSLKGVFAWITCPMILERFRHDLQLAGVDLGDLKNISFSNLVNTSPEQSTLFVSSKVVLEEYTFEVQESDTTTKIAKFISQKVFPQNDEYKFWKEKVEKDIVIISDDDFTQFAKTSTEVITRTKIDNVKGTVQSGALWTEEYLPQDTIMYTIVMFTSPRVEKDEQKGLFKDNTPDKEAEKVAEFFEKGIPEIVQIGGNQTIGKGFVRVNIIK